jgi:hypothetical protein
MKRCIYLTAVLWAFSSCSRDPEKETSLVTLQDSYSLITFNDFEALDGWGEKLPSVNKERAYSGNYSIKVDKDLEFSYGYSKLLGQVTNRRPKSLKLHTYVFVPGKLTGKAILVITLTNPAGNNAPILQKFINLEKVKDFRKWVEINEEIALPENVNETHQLNIYMWRFEATKPVYLDDLKVRALY